MTTLKWSDVYYKPVSVIRLVDDFDQVRIGDRHIDVAYPISFVDRPHEVVINQLVKSVFRIRGLTSDSCYPQLAYHAFVITRHTSFMDGYFLITKSLSKDAHHQFHETVRKVMLHSGFEVQLLDKHGANHIEKVPAIAYLIAGQIVELFFFQRDILDKLLQGTIRIWLYTDQVAFNADGGAAGGCYNPQKGCVQLVVSRLFEGFNQPTPGVAPFIHEFGHLLDYFDAETLKASGTSSGWLPGMRESDGAIYTPEAREAFIKGKRMEMQRYDRQVNQPDGSEPLPIGHPYVFQNNSEFIAGYLEMFFRNPHTFAAQNPDLFDGFVHLFRQDPRTYWEADFPYYVQQNRAFYQSGQRPRASGLKLDGG
jgi:hypothetical protein